MVDLDALSRNHLEAARRDERGRSAELVVHDGELRQSVIALVRGACLSAHNSPPAASIQVLSGRLRVELDGEVQGEVGAGELWALTHERHAVLALEDTAFLLTTVTGVDQRSYA
ncbi:cupin [Brachybacterium endophyticum]|uniref:Cupin n=1 Tax=Brachybacterium endophyticum TaxID=2182385 RepID=A0A2U2RKF7_9MICO|nr:cupin [Brachybacterium endophyticum]PWH06358.1 cupin [Brachybacterium endophyticum]